MGKRILSTANATGETLLSTYHVLRKRVDQALVRHSSSISRVKLLMFLDAEGPSRMSTIAAALNIAVRSTMDAVASLERDGMVERAGDPNDRRAVLASLTPAGRKALGEALRVSERVMNESFAHLTPAENSMLLALLEKLRAAIVAR